MGRLVVEARGTAATGAAQGIAADFTTDATIVAPGGSQVEIARLVEASTAT